MDFKHICDVKEECDTVNDEPKVKLTTEEIDELINEMLRLAKQHDEIMDKFHGVTIEDEKTLLDLICINHDIDAIRESISLGYRVW